MPNRIQEAVSYFQNALGLTLEQASGIVGNLMGESNLDPTAVGDGGLAYGIAQWHPPRQADFERQFGKLITESTFQEQLDFVAWELKNTERRALNALLGERTIAGATAAFMRLFERPKDDSSLERRVDAAKDASEGKGIVGTIGDALDDPLGTAADALAPDWLKNLFSGATAARWAAVVIGIILIGLAVAAFVLTSGNDLKASVVKAAL
jgi:hypothetical protein